MLNLWLVHAEVGGCCLVCSSSCFALGAAFIAEAAELESTLTEGFKVCVALAKCGCLEPLAAQAATCELVTAPGSQITVSIHLQAGNWSGSWAPH